MRTVLFFEPVSNLTLEQEIAVRKRDCTRQMAVFDRMSPAARAAIANSDHDADVVEAERRLRLVGLSDRVRNLLRARGVVPCDVPPDELLSLECELL